MEQKRLGHRTLRIREDIYTAAMDLFGRHGIAGVTMQDIADQAETARSTVFKHYSQKHALLSEFFVRLGNSALANAKSKKATSFRSGMTALFEGIQEEASKVESVLAEVAGMAILNGPLAGEEAIVDGKMIAHITELLKVGVSTGEISADIDHRAAAQLILCVITQTNQEAIGYGRIRRVARDHQARFDLLFEGLRA